MQNAAGTNPSLEFVGQGAVSNVDPEGNILQSGMCSILLYTTFIKGITMLIHAQPKGMCVAGTAITILQQRFLYQQGGDGMGDALLRDHATIRYFSFWQKRLVLSTHAETGFLPLY